MVVLDAVFKMDTYTYICYIYIHIYIYVCMCIYIYVYVYMSVKSNGFSYFLGGQLYNLATCSSAQTEGTTPTHTHRPVAPGEGEG